MKPVTCGEKNELLRKRMNVTQQIIFYDKNEIYMYTYISAELDVRGLRSYECYKS